MRPVRTSRVDPLRHFLDFGTPAEQRVTDAVVNGLPLAEAADQLAIRLSTARTRLKAIETKTGCHRQVDLVRLALSLPAVRQC